MPQAKEVLTVYFDERPTGIFADVAGRRVDLIDAVRLRLGYLSALVHMVADSSDLDQLTSNAMRGIEMVIDDALGMISVAQHGVSA